MADVKLKLEVEVDGSLGKLEKDLIKLKEEIKQVDITTKEGAKKFKTLGNEIRATESQVKNLNKSFEGLDTEALTGEFGKLAGGITGAMTGIAVLGGDANESMEAMIQTVGKGMAIAQGFKGATEAMTAAQRVYNQVLKANPIGLIITAIGLFIAGVVALISNGDKIIKMLDGWAEKFEFLQGPINVVKAGIQGLMDLWVSVQELFGVDVAAKVAKEADKVRTEESAKNTEWEVKRLEAIKASEKEIYDAKKKALEDRLKLAELNGEQETDEYKQLQIDKLALDADYDAKVKEAAEKKAEEERAAREKRKEESIKEEEDRKAALEKEKEDLYTKLEWENDIALRRLELTDATDEEIFLKKQENYQKELDLLLEQYGKESEEYINHQLELQELEAEFKEQKEEQDAEEKEKKDEKVLEEKEKAFEDATEYNETLLQMDKEFFQSQQDALDQALKDKLISNEEYVKAKKVLDKLEMDSENAKLAAYADAAGQAAALFGENTVAHKLFASAQAIINTYLAASNALATYTYPLGGIFAGLAIAQGLMQVAKINAITFAQGGILDGPSHAQGGIQTQFGELEGGEGVINKRSMATPSLRNLASIANTAGGGSDFSTGDGSISLSPETIAMITGGINNKKVYVSETDITATQQRVTAIEEEATL